MQWVNQWRWQIPVFSELAQITGSFLHLIASAPWKADDDTLCPQAGACAVCPKRSSHHPDLFGDELPGGGKGDKDDRCLDQNCWDEKGRSYLNRRLEEFRAEYPNLVALVSGESDEGGLEFEPAGIPILYHPDVTLCKKTDKRAIPALVVAGPGLGRIKWIQAPKETKTQLKGVHSADENGTVETPGEQILEHKREPYDRRRRQVVIEMVRGKLEALMKVERHEKAFEIGGGDALTERGMVVKTLLLLHLLLRERGWSDSAHDPMEEIPKELSWETLSTLRKDGLGSAEVREAVMDLCWQLDRLCLNALSCRLAVGLNERTNTDQYASADFICCLLGFDLLSLRAQASEEVPYAKSWREEVTDEWREVTGVANGQPLGGTA